MSSITPKHIKDFRWMIDNDYVPYQKIPEAPGKTFEEIRKLGKFFFPQAEYSFEMAMAVYDWTTADFARMQFLNLFTYGKIFTGEKHLFDFENIANAIWTSNWVPYTPSDAYYMNAFMMKPADSLENVKNQLARVLNVLDEVNTAECVILSEAIASLPKIQSRDIPRLYSGQVDINNLGTRKFGSYFVELPANNNPALPPIEIELEEALSGFMSIGNTVTLKTFMSFADTYEIAEKYTNGIVLTVFPPENSAYWGNVAFITPLSDDPDKNEYLFPPSTQFRVDAVLRNMKYVEIHLRMMQP